MKTLWNRLEVYFRQHAPMMLESFNPPATAEQTRQAESTLGLTLPADLIASLCVHNGQTRSRATALIPTEYSQPLRRAIATYGEPLPLEDIVRGTQVERAWVTELARHPDEELDIEYSGPARYDASSSWLSIVDPGSGDRIVLDMNPAPGGQAGQVVSICHDPPGLYVLAPSYQAWFEQLVERYESGRYAIVPLGNGRGQAVDRLNPYWEETVRRYRAT